LTAVALTAPHPARAQLRPGSVAPLFTAEAAQGGQTMRFSLADALKRGPVVLYFFPQAFTSGCTQEAHDFAQAMDDYRKLGAQVVGVSGDDIATLGKFSVHDCAGKFPLVADKDRAVMKAYDSVLVPMTSYASRTSYVITPDDKILYAYNALNPDQHVANTLAALTQWRATHPADAAAH
ncbi:peroxiredoxin, partial [Acidisphaera rubrifaciens]|uniref:peroxiredoxin n=1 Tax=Acidisphaera rubrifaciens TaxID=50715 RepID=UPI000662A9BD